MDKKHTKIIIIGALIIVMILAWINSIKLLNKGSNLNKAHQTSSSINKSMPSNILPVAAEEILVSKRTFNEENNLDWKRCPFSGRNYSREGAATDLIISGIIWDEVNPQTIINGQILSEGDSLGGFVVQKIEKQKVTLSSSTKTIELQI